MELWDLYDEKRRPLGRTIERGRALNPGEYHLVAAIWTADKDGHLLLTKRSPEKEFFPNEWENSGGAVLAGETSAEGTVRELQEETGIRVTEQDLILLGSCREENYHVDTYLVLLGASKPAITLQKGETADYKWVSFEEYERMADGSEVIDPAVRQTLPLLNRMKKLVEEWAEHCRKL